MQYCYNEINNIIMKTEMRTLEELKYLMKFYQLDKMPIYYENQYVGEVLVNESNIAYEKPSIGVYMAEDKYAFNLACEQIDKYIEAIKLFLSNEETSRVVVYTTTNNGRETHTESTRTGTLDKIFESVEQGNNRLRYCNGSSWDFKEEEDRHLFELWGHYIPHSRSFALFYGNGTVD